VVRYFSVYSLKDDEVKKELANENTGAEKSKLFPSDLDSSLLIFLIQYFDDIMDYGFTARIEEEFDEVAEGKLKWNTMIDDFYSPFKKDVDKTIETAERIKGERELGVDPEYVVSVSVHGPRSRSAMSTNVRRERQVDA